MRNYDDAPAALLKLAAAPQSSDSAAREQLEKVVEVLDSERCTTFEDCIAWGRRRFQVSASSPSHCAPPRSLWRMPLQNMCRLFTTGSAYEGNGADDALVLQRCSHLLLVRSRGR